MDFPASDLDKKVMADVQSNECIIEDTKWSTNQFIMCPYNLIKDRDWRIENRCSYTGYIYIATKVFRKPSKHDKYDLYHRYWKNNKIVSKVGVEELADAFGYSTTTEPRKWIRKLKAQGAFIIETMKIPGKPKPANIYVLGHLEGGVEVIYYGNIRIKHHD